MIVLSSTTQSKNDVTFVAYNSNQIKKYFANVITLTEETGSILLNGVSFQNQFTPYANSKYSWDFGDGSVSEEKDPRHNFTEMGKFLVTLKGESEYGCKDTADLTVEILPNNIFTPNAFRPDSDIPENRVFIPFTLGVDPARYHLVIFNRWGEVIFESENLENKWDGKLKNGHNAPMGNYVWKADYNDIQGFRHQRKGQVLLVR